uniref:PR domain containing 2, with ZNF domain a n=1 Tax=Hucho hucho TaxID=62062 RepID=A0A4W5NQF2_9TELE
MEDSHTLYISELGDDENLEEEMEDKELEETHCSLYLMSMETDELADSNTSFQKPEGKGCGLKEDLGSFSHSTTPELPEDPDHDPDVALQDSFPCQFCERYFTSKQGLERHIHIHNLDNHHTHTFKCKYCSKSFGSKIGRRRHERRHENAKARPGSLIKPVEPLSSALQRNGPECGSSPSSSGASVLADREQASTSDEHGELQGGHTCKYCKKVFSTHTNMRRHQRRIHERHLRHKGKEAPLLQEAKHPRLPPIKSQQDTSNKSPVAVLEIESDQEEQYMLDISGNISENLSFYIDGKIVSTSTVSGCEVVEVNSGSATLVGLNAVIINPAQISQALKVETATRTGIGIPGQPLTKRRTATPPLLPQIKTELESEVVVSSSSSSSIVSSLIESLIPQNTESTILQRERTVYLSPKLKQLLQMQDGLKPTFALITEGQKLCSALSLTVLPAGLGRFKRRTGSPPNSPQQSPMSNVESTTTDVGLSIALNAPTSESQCSSPACSLSSNDESEISNSPPVNDAMTTRVLPEGWSPMSGGSSCNQQPLDLSNAVKKSEDEALGEAVLDLSVHRKSAVDSEAKRILVPQPLNRKRKPNTSMLEKVLMNDILENHDAPLVTDFAIVTASDMSPATEGEVFGLTLPSAALSPSPSSLASVTRQSISPCTIALAPPSPHPVLPTAPSLITVLAPPTSSSSNSSNQPILQVLAPKISPKPLIILSEDISICTSKTAPTSEGTSQVEESSNETLSKLQETFTKDFICNVCDKLFHSMKELGHHVSEHSDEWPYKCEFCVLLFGKPMALLEHRSTLHGVGKSYVCCACTKEFAYLCNLKHHQKELHPGQECKYTEEENGKLRPQNYNNGTKVGTEALSNCAMAESNKPVIKDEGELDDATEELFTTIKIMASEGGKPKGLDVCLGINQHYPSFKPPPFPYHNRTPVGSVASATNFTTHNIPQTFSTAIRCTKCGKSFDNMPELHKHILACANASDKRRYTPNKNPIPLRHFAKVQNGVLSSTNTTNGQNALHTASQTNRPKLNQEPPAKLKLNALNKRKKQLVQRAISQRSKSTSLTKKTTSLVDEEQEIYVCPHCIREFTYRRSRTKHMAVCPRKPAAKEAKKRKDSSISYTKENNGHLRREVLHLEEKSDHEQKSIAHSSSPKKRTAILPAHKVLSNKKSKAIIAIASVQTPQEAPKLTALSLVRPFNSPQRQGSRMQHGVKEIPSNITMVKSHQQQPQVDEHPCSQSRGRVRGPVTRSLHLTITLNSLFSLRLTSLKLIVGMRGVVQK